MRRQMKHVQARILAEARQIQICLLLQRFPNLQEIARIRVHEALQRKAQADTYMAIRAKEILPDRNAILVAMTDSTTFVSGC